MNDYIQFDPIFYIMNVGVIGFYTQDESQANSKNLKLGLWFYDIKV